MRITCDYCGASFDTDVSSSCPKCGGGFGNDVEMKGMSDNYKEEQFLQEQMQMKAQQQQRFEARQKELDGQVKKIKAGCFIIVLIIAAIIVAPIVINSLGGNEAAVMLMNNII